MPVSLQESKASRTVLHLTHTFSLRSMQHDRILQAAAALPQLSQDLKGQRLTLRRSPKKLGFARRQLRDSQLAGVATEYLADSCSASTQRTISSMLRPTEAG